MILRSSAEDRWRIEPACATTVAKSQSTRAGCGRPPTLFATDALGYKFSNIAAGNAMIHRVRVYFPHSLTTLWIAHPNIHSSPVPWSGSVSFHSQPPHETRFLIYTKYSTLALREGGIFATALSRIVARYCCSIMDLEKNKTKKK